MFQGENETADEHVGVDHVAVDGVGELFKLGRGGGGGGAGRAGGVLGGGGRGQHRVKSLERLPVELDQLPQQVKAALENLFVANLMLHNVAGNMLQINLYGYSKSSFHGDNHAILPKMQLHSESFSSYVSISTLKKKEKRKKKRQVQAVSLKLGDKKVAWWD